MKKTLLDMVQSILSSMDADLVNTIGETQESLQVANALRDSYYEILSGLNIPNAHTLFQLLPSGVGTQPTVMYKPSNVINIDWIKYNKITLISTEGILVEPPGFYTLANGNSSYNYDVPSVNVTDATQSTPNYEEVRYLELEEFLRRMYEWGNNSNQVVSPTAATNIGWFDLQTVSGNQFQIFYRNDRAPLYFTSFDDTTILFDSYDATVDTTLQGSKTVCWGEVGQPWVMEDSFIPVLEDKQFTLLENEAKQQAFVEFKQSSNPLATQRAHKGWVRARNNKQAIPYSMNSRAKTTTGHFGRNAWPQPNVGTYRNHEPN